jgi:hypothetical protein
MEEIPTGNMERIIVRFAMKACQPEITGLIMQASNAVNDFNEPAFGLLPTG